MTVKSVDSGVQCAGFYSVVVVTVLWWPKCDALMQCCDAGL